MWFLYDLVSLVLSINKVLSVPWLRLRFKSTSNYSISLYFWTQFWPHLFTKAYDMNFNSWASVNILASYYHFKMVRMDNLLTQKGIFVSPLKKWVRLTIEQITSWAIGRQWQTTNIQLFLSGSISSLRRLSQYFSETPLIANCLMFHRKGIMCTVQLLRVNICLRCHNHLLHFVSKRYKLNFIPTNFKIFTCFINFMK